MLELEMSMADYTEIKQDLGKKREDQNVNEINRTLDGVAISNITELNKTVTYLYRNNSRENV